MDKLSAQTKGTTLDIFESKKSAAAAVDNGFNQFQLGVVDDNERVSVEVGRSYSLFDDL